LDAILLYTGDEIHIRIKIYFLSTDWRPAASRGGEIQMYGSIPSISDSTKVPIILEPGRQDDGTASMGSEDSRDIEGLGFDTFL
jgi:hypothetical protein